MENKEIKNTATELNDETLENVNGGLLVPIIIGPSNSWSIRCVTCGKPKVVPPETYEALMAAGGYYCDACKTNTTAGNADSVD